MHGRRQNKDIYLVVTRGVGKIGSTSDPTKRLPRLGGDVLVLVERGGQDGERTIHRAMSHRCLHGGREWYPAELVEELASMCLLEQRIPGRPQDALRQWRLEHGVKLHRMAMMIGTRFPTVSSIEEGARLPSVALAKKLQDLTGIEIEAWGDSRHG